MTTIFENPRPQTPENADDLRSVVGERRLIELALEAAQFVGEGLPRPEKIREHTPSPKMLLTLLAYCYASGIHGSEDIEWACENDLGVRYICANILPDQNTIRRFRRANRPWIEACLTRIHDAVCGADAGAAFSRKKIELAIFTDTAADD